MDIIGHSDLLAHCGAVLVGQNGRKVFVYALASVARDSGRWSHAGLIGPSSAGIGQMVKLAGVAIDVTEADIGFAPVSVAILSSRPEQTTRREPRGLTRNTFRTKKSRCEDSLLHAIIFAV